MIRTLLIVPFGLAFLIGAGCGDSTQSENDAVADEMPSQAGRAASSSESLPDIVDRWVSVQQGSFNLEGYLSLFAENVAFRDGATGIVAQGRSALAEAVRPFTRLSDLSPQVMRHATNGDQIFVEGALTGSAPTGERVVSRGVAVFTVADSRITSLATYFFRENVSLADGAD